MTLKLLLAVILVFSTISTSLCRNENLPASKLGYNDVVKAAENVTASGDKLLELINKDKVDVKKITDEGKHFLQATDNATNLMGILGKIPIIGPLVTQTLNRIAFTLTRILEQAGDILGLPVVAVEGIIKLILDIFDRIAKIQEHIMNGLSSCPTTDQQSFTKTFRTSVQELFYRVVEARRREDCNSQTSKSFETLLKKMQEQLEKTNKLIRPRITECDPTNAVKIDFLLKETDELLAKIEQEIESPTCKNISPPVIKTNPESSASSSNATEEPVSTPTKDSTVEIITGMQKALGIFSSNAIELVELAKSGMTKQSTGLFSAKEILVKSQTLVQIHQSMDDYFEWGCSQKELEFYFKSALEHITKQSTTVIENVVQVLSITPQQQKPQLIKQLTKLFDIVKDSLEQYSTFTSCYNDMDIKYFDAFLEELEKIQEKVIKARSEENCGNGTARLYKPIFNEMMKIYHRFQEFLGSADCSTANPAKIQELNELVTKQLSNIVSEFSNQINC